LRKFLGVWIGVAALGMTLWAQAPAQMPAPDQAPAGTPPTTQAPGQAQIPEATPIPTPAPVKAAPVAAQFPRMEIFGGGSYAEAGLFNAGHWAGLPGWDASLGLNATYWLGVLIDGGQYFGTSKIPVAVPAPFPTNPCQPDCTGPTFDATTREYNILFGVQLSRRKPEGWTPFGEILYGHQGTRGIETPQAGASIAEVSSGRAIVAGAGIDHRINERIAIRFKADYLQTGSFKQKQDNFRFSVGVVFRNVHKKKRRLEDETQLEP
jgi:hypothetical protein